MMMPVLVRRFELVEDRLHARINRQLGCPQALMKGEGLLMEGVPLVFRGACSLALQRLELLLEIGLLDLESWIRGEDCVAVLLQLGLFRIGQDGIMVMMASSGGGWGYGCVCRLGESRRHAGGSQRESHEGDAREGECIFHILLQTPVSGSWPLQRCKRNG